MCEAEQEKMTIFVHTTSPHKPTRHCHMKNKGSILDFTHQRNEELMRAFKKAIEKRRHIDIEEISREIVSTPCSRFWVSEERACVVINAIAKGRDILRTMRPTKREMFLELYQRVTELRKIYPHKTLYDIVLKAVNSKAPKFYMTPRSAIETIYKVKKGHYRPRQQGSDGGFSR